MENGAESFDRRRWGDWRFIVSPIVESDTMDDHVAQKQTWSLTREAFDRLLEQLDADRECAAEKYEQIRQRLVKLFRWRGCLLYEEYTDKTIDRVARRLAEGAEFQTENPYTLFYAVAMNILKEHWRKAEHESEALDYLVQSQPATVDPEEIRAREAESKAHDARLECLRHCLGKLTSENLSLMKKYYAEGDLLDKQQRKQTAAELGISVNALRVRAFRVRGEVERCVEQCLNGELSC
jgi:DNA-directed RNA polymerase specialized sigma24 family protein